MQVLISALSRRQQDEQILFHVNSTTRRTTFQRAILSFVPFFPLVYHAYEIALVAKTIHSPSLLSFSLLIVINMSLRLPYMRRVNRLVFLQVASVWVMNIFIVTFPDSVI